MLRASTLSAVHYLSRPEPFLCKHLQILLRAKIAQLVSTVCDEMVLDALWRS
jgi:hypothetical protein